MRFCGAQQLFIQLSSLRSRTIGLDWSVGIQIDALGLTARLRIRYRRNAEDGTWDTFVNCIVSRLVLSGFGSVLKLNVAVPIILLFGRTASWWFVGRRLCFYWLWKVHHLHLKSSTFLFLLKVALVGLIIHKKFNSLLGRVFCSRVRNRSLYFGMRCLRFLLEDLLLIF